MPDPFTARERTFSVRGIRLHCWEWGQPGRPAMLLTHGITAHGRVWDPFAAQFAQDFHVLSLDQRGHGDSGKPAAGYDAAGYGADMLAIMDAAGWQKAILVGHSLGARNSLWVAANAPQRVAAVVAIEYGPWIAADRLDELDRRVLSAPRLFDSGQQAREYLSNRYTRHGEQALSLRADYGLVEHDGHLRWKYDPESIRQTLAGFRTDIDEESLRLAVPALIIRGSQTSLYDRAAFDRLRAARPDFETVEIEGATHYVHEEQPELVARLTRGFLARVLAQETQA